MSDTFEDRAAAWIERISRDREFSHTFREVAYQQILIELARKIDRAGGKPE